MGKNPQHSKGFSGEASTFRAVYMSADPQLAKGGTKKQKARPKDPKNKNHTLLQKIEALGFPPVQMAKKHSSRKRGFPWTEVVLSASLTSAALSTSSSGSVVCREIFLPACLCLLPLGSVGVLAFTPVSPPKVCVIFMLRQAGNSPRFEELLEPASLSWSQGRRDVPSGSGGRRGPPLSASSQFISFLLVGVDSPVMSVCPGSSSPSLSMSSL